MRILRLLLGPGLAVPLALVACGGATPTLGGGNGDDGGSGDGHAGGSDAGGGSSGGGSSGGGVDCTALLAQVDDLQTKATACCAQCDIVQCTSSVPGVCCPVSVNSTTAKTTTDFEAAVSEYLQECPSECAAISCAKSPSGICAAPGECQ